MPREAVISQEQVSAAADALVSQSKKPTIRAIREIVGRGSSATILRFVQTWRDARPQLMQNLDALVAPSVARAINELLVHKAGEVEKEYQERIEEMQSNLDTLRTENEELLMELNDRTQEITSLQARINICVGQLTKYEQERSLAHATIQSEIKLREVAELSLAKAELQDAHFEDLRKELKAAREDARASAESAAELKGKLSMLKNPS